MAQVTPTMPVAISPAALAEMRRVLEGAQPGLAIRVYVDLTRREKEAPGAEFGLALDTPKSGDRELECGGVRLLVDPRTCVFLDGGEIDFTTSENGGQGFRISSPHGPSAAAEPCTRGGACS